jgi:dienelactone hydrolase
MRRRWPLVAALCVLALGFCAASLPLVRRPALAALLIPDLIPDAPSGPLRRLGAEPRREAHSYTAPDGGTIPADLYLPRACAAGCPGVVLFVGIYTPKDDPRLVRVADAMARGGIVVLAPESAAMIEGRLEPREVDALVASFQALLAQREVDPRRAGFVGFSTGGSLALVAAAHERIRDQVAFVNAFGGYADAVELLLAATTRTIELDGRLQPWQPDVVTRTVLAETLIAYVPSLADRALLGRAFVPEGLAVEALPAAASRDALDTTEGRAAFDLLSHPTRAQAVTLLAQLPPTLRADLRRLSPSDVVADLRCAVLLMHDRSDPLVPVTESRRLAGRLRDFGQAEVRYSEFDLFEHVVPGRSLGPLALAGELVRLYAHVLALMRWLA